MSKAKTAAGKTLDDFRAAFDKSFIVPKKIAAALEKLGDGWEYNHDFSKTSDVSVNDLSMFAEQFEPHIVDIAGRSRKRIWFGDPKVAAKARAMV